MNQTIESKAAGTILQKPEEIKIGDKTYTIAPPSVATLIHISESVSRLPRLHLDKDKVMEEALAIAKDCKELGDIAAVLILGAKHIDDTVETRHTEKKRHLWGLFSTSHTVVRLESKKEQLKRELLEDVTPRDLYDIIVQTLSKMQVGDFFGLTTFLTEINLMRPTKVETEATVSGR